MIMVRKDNNKIEATNTLLQVTLTIMVRKVNDWELGFHPVME